MKGQVSRKIGLGGCFTQGQWLYIGLSFVIVWFTNSVIAQYITLDENCVISVLNRTIQVDEV